jgi:uncharacterized protein (DUF433 family)
VPIERKAPSTNIQRSENNQAPTKILTFPEVPPFLEYAKANREFWRGGNGIAFPNGLGQNTVMVFKRITCNPKRMNGQPCIRDLRLTVRRVVEAAAMYPDRRDLRREFPELEDEDIREALAYAAANLDDKVIELTKAQ